MTLKAAFILAYLTTILVIVASISSVYATNVTIGQVNYPQSLTYGSSGTISISVPITAAYAAGPEQDGQYPGSWGVLGVYLIDAGTGNAIVGTDVIVTSTPAPCKQGSTSGLTGTPQTYCALLAMNPMLVESFVFTFSGTHIPNAPEWHLRVQVLAFDGTDNSENVAHSDFTIAISQ